MNILNLLYITALVVVVSAQNLKTIVNNGVYNPSLKAMGSGLSPNFHQVNFGTSDFTNAFHFINVFSDKPNYKAPYPWSVYYPTALQCSSGGISLLPHYAMCCCSSGPAHQCDTGKSFQEIVLNSTSVAYAQYVIPPFISSNLVSLVVDISVSKAKANDIITVATVTNDANLWNFSSYAFNGFSYSTASTYSSAFLANISIGSTAISYTSPSSTAARTFQVDLTSVAKSYLAAGMTTITLRFSSSSTGLGIVNPQNPCVDGSGTAGYASYYRNERSSLYYNGTVNQLGLVGSSFQSVSSGDSAIYNISWFTNVAAWQAAQGSGLSYIPVLALEAVSAPFLAICSAGEANDLCANNLVASGNILDMSSNVIGTANTILNSDSTFSLEIIANTLSATTTGYFNMVVGVFTYPTVSGLGFYPWPESYYFSPNVVFSVTITVP